MSTQTGCSRPAIILTLALLCGSHANATAISVNTVTDEINSNGNCSLREAIRAANTNLPVDGCAGGSAMFVDIITLQNGVTYGLSRVGEDDTALAGDLDITDDLILIGNASIVDANGATTQDRVLQVLAGHVVDISNLTVQDGRPSFFGGGIRSGGSLTLNNVTVRDNESSGNGGGGIFTEAGTLTLIDTDVISNQARSRGGGLVNSGGSVNATNSTFNNNIAVEDRGGGIHFASPGSLTLTDCEVSGNQAATLGGGIFGNSSITLIRTAMIGNIATSTGGGIYNQGTLNVTDSTIANNSADDSAGMINDDGSLTMRGTAIRGNTAISVGGLRNTNSGVARLINTTISGNQATASAGGIANGSSASMELSNVTIAFNTADSDANNSGDGGGLANSATVTARNTLIGNNGDPSPTGNRFPDCSGALVSAGNNLVENITGCTISGNTVGNITSQDPDIRALANNGGPTLTHAFPSGAPPHNAGNANGCLDHAANAIATDQRGTARAQPTRCDIGALESDNTSPEATAILLVDSNPTSAPIVRFNVLFSEPVTGVVAARFSINASAGISGASIVGVTGSGSSYTVSVATGSGNGNISLLFAVPGQVRDLALNPANIPFLSDFYVIDRSLAVFKNGFE